MPTDNCPTCGSPIGKEHAFCKNCGESIRTVSVPAPGETVPSGAPQSTRTGGGADAGSVDSPILYYYFGLLFFSFFFSMSSVLFYTITNKLLSNDIITFDSYRNTHKIFSYVGLSVSIFLLVAFAIILFGSKKKKLFQSLISNLYLWLLLFNMVLGEIISIIYHIVVPIYQRTALKVFKYIWLARPTIIIVAFAILFGVHLLGFISEKIKTRQFSNANMYLWLLLAIMLLMNFLSICFGIGSFFDNFGSSSFYSIVSVIRYIGYIVGFIVFITVVVIHFVKYKNLNHSWM